MLNIVTAANFRYKQFLNTLEKSCQLLNYNLEIYDLGNLNRGIPSFVDNTKFQNEGWYNVVHGEWRSKALHKPSIVLNSLKNNPLTYLDADAIPVMNFDEVWDYEFDIGVTARCPEEPKILGPINAGVIFFRPTAKKAVEKWRNLTDNIGNDQRALAMLIQDQDFKIKYFPAKIYNYYKFPIWPGPEVKIYHFKDDKNVRPCFNEFVRLHFKQPL